MQHSKISFQLSLLILLLGCSNPADKVAEAKVSNTNASPALSESVSISQPAQSEARSYAFGPESSSIEFLGSKVTGKHKGGFKNFAGELHGTKDRLSDAGNKVVIDTRSIWTDTDRLTGHLKSSDFFNVAQIPTATFISTSIAQEGTNSTVTGNLTLHGITKQISFPASIKVSEASIELIAEFFINRFDFEMKYPGKADDLIRKEVVLKLNIQAIPGKANFEAIGEVPAKAASL
jgi:polyisoprenoid-binding protein YceI